jgi:hypothetical protein
MSDTRLTDQECADCFHALWKGAIEARPFDSICAMVRVSGMQDAGWDPFEESEKAFQDYNWHLKAQSDDLSEKSQWRIGLLMYCQACEMSAVHHMLANILRIHLGQPYHMNPLGSLGRADKKRMFKWYPPSAKVKWHKIREMAEQAKKVDLVRLIDAVYDDRVRNAFSHSDYTITDEKFRWTEGGLPDQLSLGRLDNLISNAFAFFGRFMAQRDLWLKLAGKMPRYHCWPNYEVFELLKSDGTLNGFRVHFSNGSSARFRRTPDGVDLMNVVIQRDGTINLMVGLLDALQERYVVDGNEVQFGDQRAVDTFAALQQKSRVVRHTFNAAGELAERAVISGTHPTREDAKAALRREATRHPKHELLADGEKCKITDKNGKEHWILIEDAIA